MKCRYQSDNGRRTSRTFYSVLRIIMSLVLHIHSFIRSFVRSFIHSSYVRSFVPSYISVWIHRRLGTSPLTRNSSGFASADCSFTALSISLLSLFSYICNNYNTARSLFFPLSSFSSGKKFNYPRWSICNDQYKSKT